MRVLIGFFGITRSLRHTLPSIEQNILAPLRQSGAEIRRYGHFHLPEFIDNPRSAESRQPTDIAEADLLNLDVCEIEPQNPTLVEPSMNEVRAYPDTLRDNYASARNLCFQLRSLNRLWSLMARDAAATNAATILFLRPDLRYLDPIDIPALAGQMRAAGASLAVPDWHQWGGLNDRFALATVHAARIYATRLHALRAGLHAYGGLHGESLLAHAVATAGLRVMPLPVRALRIRAHGAPEPRDLQEFNLT